MNRSPLQLRALRVIGDLCNEIVEPRDREWLEGLLCSDPEILALYIDYLAMHGSLHAEGASLELIPSATVDERAGADLLSLAPRFSAEPNEELRSGQLLSRFATTGRRPYMLAAALVGIAVFSSLLTFSMMSGSMMSRLGGLGEFADAAGDGKASAPRRVVAQITGTQDCLWRQGPQAIGYGSELVAGQKLELREGLAELTFEDGATVLLESPATFVVNAPHEVNLHQGRLAATVPPQSRGFRVHTRSLDVFDVGTEFGMLAKRSGAAEVHVFNGLVKADVLDSSGRRLRRLELNASEAARVNLVSTTVLEFPANEAAFVRSMLPTSGPKDGLLAYEGFAYPEGPLAAQNGGFGWAGPWFDIAADREVGPDSNRVSRGSLTTKGLLPLGNRAMQTGHQNRIRRSLATSVGGVFDAAGLVENQDGVRLVGRDGNHVYISFLQRVSKTDDDFYGFELHRGDGNPNRVLCIGNGAEATGYGVTSNTNVYGPKNFPSLGTEDTEAHLFVVKISFGVDNHDVVEVFRIPDSLKDEKACRVDAVLKGNFAFDRISMSSFHGSKIHEVDEIRVGTHFLAVTGRWGGERGRLLRRFTRHSTPDRGRASFVRGMADMGVSRNPLLAASSNRWATASFVRQ